MRDGRTRWDGASGVADVRVERPVTPNMRHRVGSITKTFMATAILQQVEKGRIDLDAPVNDYLPGLVPAMAGEQVTVRMLLNHTSGIGDYMAWAFPSLRELSPRSLEDHRFRSVPPEQLRQVGPGRSPEPASRGSAGRTRTPTTSSPGCFWRR